MILAEAIRCDVDQQGQSFLGCVHADTFTLLACFFLKQLLSQLGYTDQCESLACHRHNSTVYDCLFAKWEGARGSQVRMIMEPSCISVQLLSNCTVTALKFTAAGPCALSMSNVLQGTCATSQVIITMKFSHHLLVHICNTLCSAFSILEVC